MAEEKQKKEKKGQAVALKAIAAVIATLVVVTGIVLYMNIGSIAKSMAEKVGSHTLGVKVSIGSIDVNPAELSITVNSISIANPSGYKKPHAMTAEQVNIKAGSLSKELLVFEDVSVRGANMYMEVTEHGTNFSALKKNVDKNRKVPVEGAEKEKTPPKVILDHFLLSGAQVQPSVTLIGGDLSPVKVPDVRLRGIGKKQNGVLAREAIAQIWAAVSSTAVEASAEAGYLQGLSPDVMKDVTSTLNISGSFESQAKDMLNNATEGLKGLFGN